MKDTHNKRQPQAHYDEGNFLPLKIVGAVLGLLLLGSIWFFSTRSSDGFVSGLVQVFTKEFQHHTFVEEQRAESSIGSLFSREKPDSSEWLPPLPADTRQVNAQGRPSNDPCFQVNPFRRESQALVEYCFSRSRTANVEQTAVAANGAVRKHGVLQGAAQPLSGSQSVFNDAARVENEHLQYRNMKLMRDQRCMPFVDLVLTAASVPRWPPSADEYNSVEAALTDGYGAGCFVLKEPTDFLSPEFRQYWQENSAHIKSGGSCAGFSQQTQDVALSNLSEQEKRYSLAKLYVTATQAGCYY